MDECNLYLSENSYDTAFFHTGHKLGELVNWWSHTGLAAFKASLYSHFTVARKRQRAAFNTHRSLLAAKCWQGFAAMWITAAVCHCQEVKQCCHCIEVTVQKRKTLLKQSLRKGKVLLLFNKLWFVLSKGHLMTSAWKVQRRRALRYLLPLSSKASVIAASSCWFEHPLQPIPNEHRS